MSGIDFSINSPLVTPIDEAAPKVGPPSQTAEGEEYICGNSGREDYGSTTPGRDQDRSRLDERTPAIGCGRYIGA